MTTAHSLRVSESKTMLTTPNNHVDKEVLLFILCMFIVMPFVKWAI